MQLFYSYRGLIGTRNVLDWLIGRKPLSYADWVDMRVKEEERKRHHLKGESSCDPLSRYYYVRTFTIKINAGKALGWDIW